jgi:AcrR family transcriptional regulator
VDAAIIGAAAALLGEIGYSGLRMEAVASRAGVSKATLYRRYRDKDALITATILATTGAPPNTMPFPEGSVRLNLTFMLKVASVAMANPAWLTILGTMLSDRHSEGGLLNAIRAQIFDPSAEAVQKLVELGKERGELQPSVSADMVNDVMVGAMLVRSMLGKPITDEWIEAFVASVWKGFGNGADADTPGFDMSSLSGFDGLPRDFAGLPLAGALGQQGHAAAPPQEPEVAAVQASRPGRSLRDGR